MFQMYLSFFRTINQVIGMSHGKEPMEIGHYHDIIHHDFIHFEISKMVDTQNYQWKIHLTFAIN